jgi:hypothetical protein
MNDTKQESFTPAHQPADSGENAGYKRRPCSKCGEGLGFTESDPCERCDDEPPSPDSSDAKPEDDLIEQAMEFYYKSPETDMYELMAEFARQVIAADRIKVIDEFVESSVAYLDKKYGWGLYPVGTFEEAMRSVAEEMKRK